MQAPNATQWPVGLTLQRGDMAVQGMWSNNCIPTGKLCAALADAHNYQPQCWAVACIEYRTVRDLMLAGF